MNCCGRSMILEDDRLEPPILEGLGSWDFKF